MLFDHRRLRDFKEQSDRLVFSGGLPGSLEATAPSTKRC
jgi:hypothetical protein